LRNIGTPLNTHPMAEICCLYACTELPFSWVRAGLKQYDPDGVDAKAIEEAIEVVHVISHGKYIAQTVILGYCDYLLNSVARILSARYLMLSISIFVRIID
jgi:hypothetical protein